MTGIPIEIRIVIAIIYAAVWIGIIRAFIHEMYLWSQVNQ